MKILFTCVGRRVELIQAFRSAAKTLNKDLTIYGVDYSETAPALFFCDQRKKVCKISDCKYIPTLLSICKEEKIDAVIPTIDTDLLLLSENKGRFEAFGTKVIISDLDKIQICRDKLKTAEFFLNTGLRTPIPVADWASYNGGYPAFIKPKDGSSSVNAYKVSDSKELEIYANEINEYIVAPFINGTEYTVDVFCDFYGNPIYITPRIRMAVRSGEVLKTKISQDRKIISETEILIKKFNPCGALTVQLIRDNETEEDYFIEINPRFGGGAPLSMKAGANSAEAIIKLLQDEKLRFVENAAKDGAIFSRFDQSVCVGFEND